MAYVYVLLYIRFMRSRRYPRYILLSIASASEPEKSSR